MPSEVAAIKATTRESGAKRSDKRRVQGHRSASARRTKDQCLNLPPDSNLRRKRLKQKWRGMT